MNEPTEELLLDFKTIFESSPDLYLLLSPDFTIVASSVAYLQATITRIEDIRGRNLFDVFPDNPKDPDAMGVYNLRRSLQTVLAERRPNRMEVQKYDIQRPDGTFEERFWEPLNAPVLAADGTVKYIIHKVEDVTASEVSKKLLFAHERKNEALEQQEKQHLQDLRTSETNFSVIFDLCPVAILKLAIDDGRLLRVNNAFEKMFLLKRDEVVGKTVMELNIIDRAVIADIVNQLSTKEGGELELELEIKFESGDIKNVLASAEIIEVNNRRCILVAMMDITHRKHMEGMLKNTNHFLDNILENLPSMVFVKSVEDLKFVRLNKAGEELLGYRSEELLGKNDFDFFPAEQAANFVRNDRAVFEMGKLLDIEEPIQTRNGERWLRTKKIPVYRDGKPAYLLGIADDITLNKKQRDALLELNKELEAFSYSVSHDLRAPLRAVTGYAEIMEADYGDKLDEEGRRMLSRISRNAEKMGRLIDDLLSFSKLGKRELQLKATDMNDLVTTVINELSKDGGNNTTFIFNNLHPAMTDYGMMKQVLTNLIGNGVKYSSKNERAVVTITSCRNGDELVYAVKDNGAGFDMQYKDKLFGVFQRLHRQDEFEGTGVGLAIVQRIIKKHGGRVWAEGKMQEGATFSFSIPLK